MTASCIFLALSLGWLAKASTSEKDSGGAMITIVSPQHSALLARDTIVPTLSVTLEEGPVANLIRANVAAARMCTALNGVLLECKPLLGDGSQSIEALDITDKWPQALTLVEGNDEPSVRVDMHVFEAWLATIDTEGALKRVEDFNASSMFWVPVASAPPQPLGKDAPNTSPILNRLAGTEPPKVSNASLMHAALKAYERDGCKVRSKFFKDVRLRALMGVIRANEETYLTSHMLGDFVEEALVGSNGRRNGPPQCVDYICNVPHGGIWLCSNVLDFLSKVASTMDGGLMCVVGSGSSKQEALLLSSNANVEIVSFDFFDTGRSGPVHWQSYPMISFVANM